MNSIHLKPLEQFKSEANVLFFVKKQTPHNTKLYELRKRYSIYDCLGNFIGLYYIKDLQVISFQELTGQHSYLDLNTNLIDYIKILEQRHNNSLDSSHFFLLTLNQNKLY